MSLADRVAEKDWAVVREMTGASTDVASAIAWLTNSADRDVRTLAIACLDEIGGPVARAAFLNALDDREEDVRDAAVRAIEHHATSEDTKRLLQMTAGHSDQFVRERLALTVGRIGEASAIGDLRKELAAGQPTEVAAALRLAMGRLGDRESKQAVLQELEVADVAGRREAIEHFVYLHDPSAAGRLMPLLDDKRDGKRAGTFSSNYFLRICDLAVDALGETLGPSAFSFSVGQYRRYSDQELGEVKGRLRGR